MHASITRYAKTVFNAAAALSTILPKLKQTKIRYLASILCVSVKCCSIQIVYAPL